MYDTCPINIFDFRAYKICISSRKTFIWFSEGKQSRDDPEIGLHILLVFFFFQNANFKITGCCPKMF